MIVKFKVTTSTVIGILLVIGIIVTGYFYFLAKQPTTQPATGVDAKFAQYAQQLGLDTTKFSQCLSTRKFANQVSTDENDGIAAGVQGTPAFFINNELVSGALPYTNFQTAIQSALASGQTNNIPLGVNPPRGATSGSVVIVEFSDYQCPYCGAVEPTIEKVLQNYPQVTLYYRNFPLTQLHPNAQKAAEAAQCAGEQGKFWEYHDLLFANQQEWASG